eukprot:g78314.t1
MWRELVRPALKSMHWQRERFSAARVAARQDKNGKRRGADKRDKRLVGVRVVVCRLATSPERTGKEEWEDDGEEESEEDMEGRRRFGTSELMAWEALLAEQLGGSVGPAPPARASRPGPASSGGEEGGSDSEDDETELIAPVGSVALLSADCAHGKSRQGWPRRLQATLLQQLPNSTPADALGGRARASPGKHAGPACASSWRCSQLQPARRALLGSAQLAQAVAPAAGAGLNNFAVTTLSAPCALVLPFSQPFLPLAAAIGRSGPVGVMFRDGPAVLASATLCLPRKSRHALRQPVGAADTAATPSSSSSSNSTPSPSASSSFSSSYPCLSTARGGAAERPAASLVHLELRRLLGQRPGCVASAQACGALLSGLARHLYALSYLSLPEHTALTTPYRSANVIAPTVGHCSACSRTQASWLTALSSLKGEKGNGWEGRTGTSRVTAAHNPHER